MKNEKTNGKRGTYKVNAQRQKDKLANSGHYTIHSIHLQSVLTLREYALLEAIRHEIETSTNPISYSILEINTGFTRKQISENKKSLICLGFITSIRETHLGGLYKVHTSEIVKIVEKLNNCYNRIERLRIADKFRTDKGLKAQNTSTIEKYTGSGFDIDNALQSHNAERYEATIPEANNEKGKEKKREKKEANTATPEKKPEPIQKPVQNVSEKEIKPFPAYLTNSLHNLNRNEAEKRCGNDMYYNQSKEVYLNEFQKYSNNAFEPFFDGIFWKAKPNNVARKECNNGN
jgi:hypothetical protein